MPTSTEIKKLFFLFIFWRIGLFFIGLVAPFILVYRPSFPYFDRLLPFYSVPQWLYSWANFDGVHYLTIAEKGYIGTGSVQAFFPLLPFVILHGMRLFLGSSFNALITGLLITNVSTLLLLIIFYAFVKKLRDTKIAWFSVFALIVFPTSFFLAALYTESLFLLLVIAAFYSAEKKWWFWAGLAVMLASATRIVGIFLVPALLLELILQEFNYHSIWKLRSKKNLYQEMLLKTIDEIKIFIWKNWKEIIWILAGVLGAVFYMIFLDINFRDPLYFAHVQASFGSGRSTNAFVTYPQVLYRSVRILMTARPFDLKYWAYVQEFLAGTLTLLGLFFAAKYVRFSHLFFAVAAFIVPTLTGSFSSMPRYILVCFPLYIAFGELIHYHKKLGIVWITVSTALLILNTLLFIQGYWVA